MTSFRGQQNSLPFTAGEDLLQYQIAQLGTTKSDGNKTLITPTAITNRQLYITANDALANQSVGGIPVNSPQTVKLSVGLNRTIAAGALVGIDSADLRNINTFTPSASGNIIIGRALEGGTSTASTRAVIEVQLLGQADI